MDMQVLGFYVTFFLSGAAGRFVTPLKKQLEISANLSYMKFTAADSARIYQ